jgi:hypothetical protein
MNDQTRRMAAALLLGLAAPTLAGCSPEQSAMKKEDGRAIEAAVASAVPEAAGAFASFAWSGAPNTQSILVRVYVDQTDPTFLAATAETTFETVWRNALREPSSISFQAAEGARPSQPASDTLGNLDLAPLGEQFPEAHLGIAGQVLKLSRDELADRYGPWSGKDAG